MLLSGWCPVDVYYCPKICDLRPFAGQGNCGVPSTRRSEDCFLVSFTLRSPLTPHFSCNGFPGGELTYCSYYSFKLNINISSLYLYSKFVKHFLISLSQFCEKLLEGSNLMLQSYIILLHVCIEKIGLLPCPVFSLESMFWTVIANFSTMNIAASLIIRV